VEELLGHSDIDVNLADRDLRSPLYKAAFKNNYAAVTRVAEFPLVDLN